MNEIERNVICRVERAIYITFQREMEQTLRTATDGDSGSFHKYELFLDYTGPIYENIEIDNAIDREMKHENL